MYALHLTFPLPHNLSAAITSPYCQCGSGASGSSDGQNQNMENKDCPDFTFGVAVIWHTACNIYRYQFIESFMLLPCGAFIFFNLLHFCCNHCHCEYGIVAKKLSLTGKKHLWDPPTE